MAASTIPQRPRKVTLALYMLYLSLGISVIVALVTWLHFGTPGPTGYFLLNFVMMIAAFHFEAPAWGMHGGFLPVLIVPLAVWLYYMIGKGKNWARTTFLVLVILQALDFIVGLVISLSFPQLSGPTLSLTDILPTPLILQIALQMAAATLLYARVSSDWFVAVRSCSEQPTNKGRGRIIKLTLGLLGLLIVSVSLWQTGTYFQDRALIEAVRKNDVTQVRGLLEKGADINTKDSHGFPLLTKAAEWGRLEIVKLLLDKGADVNAKTTGGLHTPAGRTALMNASWKGHSDIVKLLLTNGADINARDESRKTALMRASWTNHPQVVKLLLEKGVGVNAQDSNGSTALMMAAMSDHFEVARLLLDKGADMDAQDGRGLTALMQSLPASRDIATLLLAKGADVNVKDNQGCTALMNASSISPYDVVKLIIGKGADVNARCVSAMPALMVAAARGRVDIVRLLLDHGADVHAKDERGKTALTEASEKSLTEIMKLLKAHGANE